MRYHLRPKRYLWRSVRLCEQHLSPLFASSEDTDLEEEVGLNPLPLLEREQR